MIEAALTEGSCGHHMGPSVRHRLFSLIFIGAPRQSIRHRNIATLQCKVGSAFCGCLRQRNDGDWSHLGYPIRTGLTGHYAAYDAHALLRHARRPARLFGHRSFLYGNFRFDLGLSWTEPRCWPIQAFFRQHSSVKMDQVQRRTSDDEFNRPF